MNNNLQADENGMLEGMCWPEGQFYDSRRILMINSNQADEAKCWPEEQFYACNTQFYVLRNMKTWLWVCLYTSFGIELGFASNFELTIWVNRVLYWLYFCITVAIVFHHKDKMYSLPLYYSWRFRSRDLWRIRGVIVNLYARIEKIRTKK